MLSFKDQNLFGIKIALKGIMTRALAIVENIKQKIYFIRDQKVMLDSDLAELYKVRTKALIQAVKRNKERFPKDLMFQLKKQEVIDLRSQIVTSSSWGGRRSPPYAFTEQGVAMLSSVLRSKRAIQGSLCPSIFYSQFSRIFATGKTFRLMFLSSVWVCKTSEWIELSGITL